MAELDKRGWSRSEAARRGGFSASMFDKVVKGHSKPGIKFFRGISTALGIPISDVIAASNAQYIPDEAVHNLQEWINIYKYAPPETQTELLALVRTYLTIKPMATKTK